MRQSWTQLEDEFLKNNWSSADKETIQNFFYYRSWYSIKSRAKKIGSKHRTLRKTDISPLLEETPLAYYWAGVATADALIKPRKLSNGYWVYRLAFCVAYHDKNYWDNLVNLIKSQPNKHNPKYDNRYYFESYDPRLEIFANKFDLKPQKTFNPPKSNLCVNWEEWQFIPYYTGLICADGHIGSDKYGNINIQLHQYKTWIGFVYQLSNILLNNYNIKTSVSTRKDNMCSIVIYTNKQTQHFKQLVNRYNLPYMKRKWDKITI